MQRKWHRYRYKNFTYLLISFVIAFFLFKSETFHIFLFNLSNLGYIGAFIAGLLFVSTFSVAAGTVILLILAEKLSPIEIGIIAGMGAVVGDLTIFHFVRSRGLVDEIKHFFKYFGGDKISHLLHSKYFSWTLPVIGAAIIASPLPDELGVSLMGISKMKTYQFLITSFLLNAVGIFLIIIMSLIVKP